MKITNEEIRIYPSKLSKIVIILFIIVFLASVAFFFTNIDFSNENDILIGTISFIILAIVLYLYLKPYDIINGKPQIILSKEKFWTKNTDWIQWENVMLLNEYFVKDSESAGFDHYCNVYLYDFMKIPIYVENLEPMIKYVQDNFPEKYINEHKRNILDDLTKFRERYSVSDKEFVQILNEKLDTNIIVPQNKSKQMIYQSTKNK